MHHIQAKILKKLLYTESSNYAALKPENIESNHFAYHLEQLMKEGYVEKQGKRYALSPKGLAYVDRLSQERMIGRMQAAIVTAIDVKTANGKTLLFRRGFQPMIHKIDLPMGKVHIDETIAEAAKRELAEKTGVEDIPLAYRGMAYVTTRIRGVMITKKLYHVFHGEVPREVALAEVSNRGEAFWAKITDLKLGDLMPGFLDIQALLASSDKLFFSEITHEIED